MATMFRPGSTRTVRVDQAVAQAAGEVQVRIGADGVAHLVDSSAEPGVCLSLDRDVLDPDELIELSGVLLGVPGVVPMDVGIREDGCVDVPLLEHEEVDEDSSTWQITRRLDLVHQGTHGITFEVDAWDDSGELRLSGVETWRLVRVLVSVARWQLELEDGFDALARDLRRELRGQPAPDEQVAVFAGESAGKVEVPTDMMRRLRVACDGPKFRMSELTDGPGDVAVELDVAWALGPHRRRQLCAALASVRGVVPPRWLRGGGRASVPYLEIAAGDAELVQWKVTEQVALAHYAGESAGFLLNGDVGRGSSLRLRLTWTEARQLLRALVSVEAWREELQVHADTAMIALRLARGERIETDGAGAGDDA